MADCTCIKEGDYLAHCTAYETSPGVWEPFVLFERSGDFAATFVQAMRHRVSGKHGSRNDALNAAVTYAAETAQRGEVGL